MCYVKRVYWACGCYLGVKPDRSCDKKGTPDCKRRHLLDRIHLTLSCQDHDTTPPGTNRRRDALRRQYLRIRRYSNGASTTSTSNDNTSNGAGAARDSGDNTTTTGAVNGNGGTGGDGVNA